MRWFTITALIFVAVAVLLALPVFAIGIDGPIVVCGGPDGPECTICHIPYTIKNIIDYVIEFFVFPASLLMVIAGGFMILTAGASQQRMETGKKVLTNTLIGIVFVFFSWFIVDTIILVMTGGSFMSEDVGAFRGIGDLLPWNKLPPTEKCPLGGPVSLAPPSPPPTPSPQPPLPPPSPPPPPGEWTFDPGIKNQLSDASVSLNNLLSCMRSKLPSGIGRISSISDSNFIGNLGACNVSPCPANCAHGCGSCHYGGGTGGNKSLAVDFGDENNKLPLIGAAQACGIGSGHIIDEGNHIHVSTNDCPKN